MTLEPIETWRARGRPAAVLGRSLFRVEAGSSPRTPVVLVHGFPTCSHDWSAVLPLLAETRRVLAVDLLGYGLSEKPWPHEYSIAEQTDLLEAWLAQEGITRAHVLAHDMGDTVVQELLARRLDAPVSSSERSESRRFEPASLVLTNGGLIVERVRPILAQKLLRSRTLGAIAARLIGRRAFGRSLKGIAGKLPSEDELDQLYALVVADGGKRVYSGLIGYMNERVARRDRWRRSTLEHPYPMRLVWGDVDPISPFSICEEIRACRPATDVVRLSGTGHYPQIEEPERVSLSALEWFDKHEG